jgi:heme-degrading monooxygenase HmoA
MATLTAKPGKMGQLVEAAQEHAAALRAQPGFVAAYVLQEAGGTGQVSMSIFESKEAFLRAAEKTKPVIAKHNVERLIDGEPGFRFFEVS